MYTEHTDIHNIQTASLSEAKNTQHLDIGIDVGSTTTKIAVTDPESRELLFSDYRRHNAEQAHSVRNALLLLKEKFPEADIRAAMTGSGAKTLSEMMGTHYVQEVVANSVALAHTYENVGTAIELGGQDAKMIFFRRDETTNALSVADMRMNGSCAGGTGAFIDEVAQVLKIPVEEMNAHAEAGKRVYSISGRCGVYAKTDIQPLLNQGIAKEDVALSSFHAISKQTIGGLAQGLDIHAPVVFEGGPLTFNPKLIDVFTERLELKPEEVLCPEKPEIMIAYGAALSLSTMFGEDEEWISPDVLLNSLTEEKIKEHLMTSGDAPKFFASEEEQRDFIARHPLAEQIPYSPKKGETVRAYLGIDSGSTTTKFVLMDEEEEILDFFYASNEGEPLLIAKKALLKVRDRYERAGAKLEILAAGSTGYGELLFNKAFHTECHVVETVAHVRAAEKYVDNASFILDIGGQDMKAIWLDNGVITNIVVNEACSSGCGSFLENFAGSLNIPVTKIADEAFASAHPAALGSRCTVFMNSSIITEQRNGKQPGDIMAGLCRSIIDNVFTKVIRVSNLESLGDKIVVQGGTFRNNAVLRAFEQYTGKEVTRAPYPGMMGAIGAAIITKERMERGRTKRSFIGLDAVASFSYTQETNHTCPFCANHCKRTVVKFTDGTAWVTNNRCERGEILGDPRDAEVQDQVRKVNVKKNQVPNLFKTRTKLLFRDYPVQAVAEEKQVTIGLPRVLSFWDTMPFWTTFWRALGFRVEISDFSTRSMYESGLSAVTSDTVCFPAKLVHGHLRNLAAKKVDHIFMPSITTVESENTEKTSESMCAVVKGYPIVVRNSDNPETKFGIPFHSPLFHWHTNEDRARQLSIYMQEHFQITPEQTEDALVQADAAEAMFHHELKVRGQEILDQVTREGAYAVILASRPYQNDILVNHRVSDMFTAQNIPVLTADAVPGSEEVDLSNLRIDVVNNYHARMLSCAVLAAQSPNLEFVQLVSFGCGHDAYLSDEIIRLMKEISGKTPLVLKLDESDVQGPLRIRVRSFTETIAMRRVKAEPVTPQTLKDPYPVKFTKASAREMTVLVPNTSHAFCRIMSAAIATQHIKTVPLEIGREEAIRYGKSYVNNDICFPCQIVIGEILAAMRSGKYDPDRTAVAMGKYIGDCRLTHYSALLRKALDDAGYPQVPILTNDDVDYHNMHPGFRMSLKAAVRLAFALPMIDVMEELLRKIRPYELVEGSTEKAFEEGMDAIVEGMEKHGIRGLRKGFKKAVALMKAVRYDRTERRPRVLIVGEYLLNFHPGANHDIELYLENNGFEIIEARMTDVIQKSYFYQDAQIREYKIKTAPGRKIYLRAVDTFFDMAHDLTDSIAKDHPLYTRAARMQDVVKESDQIFHHTFDAGEGVLIPGEILHHAKEGCRSFVILQPFGCLPNHVVGRGIIKKLRELYPDSQILPLDYDPDVSFANIENRLQMLIMNAKTGNVRDVVTESN
ncbi:MAG: acyl-CoA dehydratase activase [Lachnospiraceae bacterium]|nr:acyl-CoA dehydratase activase [Lachnospiraceae bacterium]